MPIDDEAAPRPVQLPPEKAPARSVRPRPSLDHEELPRPGGYGLAAVGGVLFLVATAGVVGWLVLKNAPRKADEAAEAAAPNPPPAGPGAGAGPAGGLAPPALTGEQVHVRLLKSAVFILSTEKAGRGLTVASGSGTLVDKPHRLVLTNYHVVEEKPRVSLFFPAFDDTGELITKPGHYIQNVDRLRIWGKVVARAPGVDLAVVQLDKVSAAAVVLPLAAKPAATGAAVYSIGASGVNLQDFSGALWRFSTGTVRGRYRDRIHFRTGQSVEAMFLETQKPINPGDSGGPTVNDRGELVAVVSASDQRKDLVKLDIDLTEVRAYLKAFATRDGWAWEDTVSPAPRSPDAPAANAPALPADQYGTPATPPVFTPDTRQVIRPGRGNPRLGWRRSAGSPRWG